MRPIPLHTKPRVLLMATLWFCFVVLYQTYQSPISLYSSFSINLFFKFNFCGTNFVSKQLSTMLLNSYHFQQHYGFSIMVLAKPWYHTAIICATKNKF